MADSRYQACPVCHSTWGNWRPHPAYLHQERCGTGIDDKATQQQITELQSAVTQNAEIIRTLASDLKSAIAAIEQGGETIEARFRRLELLSDFALALSVLSAMSVLALWLR